MVGKNTLTWLYIRSFLQKNEAIIIMLCDQPFLKVDVLYNMETAYIATNAEIVACEYAGQLGVPILFNNKLFSQLQQLNGDEGARKIVKNHTGKIAKIPFEKGEIDIDSAEDLKYLE